MKNGKTIEEVIEILYSDLENVDIIVAHNIGFDINVILAECHRVGNKGIIRKISDIPKYCTMENGKLFMKSSKRPKLVELYQYLFNKMFEQKHRALSDVEYCADCYFKIV